MTHLYILSFRDCFFFFNDTATTEIYTLSLHDALPIYAPRPRSSRSTSPREVPVRTGWLALTSFSPRRPLRRRTSRAPKHEVEVRHGCPRHSPRPWFDGRARGAGETEGRRARHHASQIGRASW